MPTREYIGQSAAAISGASTATTAATISANRQRHVIASATERMANRRAQPHRFERKTAVVPGSRTVLECRRQGERRLWT
jgi:hypothetical protein